MSLESAWAVSELKFLNIVIVERTVDALYDIVVSLCTLVIILEKQAAILKRRSKDFFLNLLFYIPSLIFCLFLERGVNVATLMFVALCSGAGNVNGSR